MNDPTRCRPCGAKIIDGACHCGAAGRMREPHDAADAVAAWEEMNPEEAEIVRGDAEAVRHE